MTGKPRWTLNPGVHYIAKPFRGRELAEKIRGILDGRG